MHCVHASITPCIPFTLNRTVAYADVLVQVLGGDYLLQIGILVAIFAILALSLTLISGTAGQISIGQAGPFAVGAYVSALLTRDHGWSFWLAFPVAGIVAAFISIVIMAPGMGSSFGVVIGTLILIGVPELFRPLQDVRYLGYGVLLLLLIRFRPQGLWGKA